MKSFRSLLGLIAISAGVSLVYYGMTTHNSRLTLAGILAGLWGIWASLHKLLCKRCGRHAWVSGKGPTHCRACGASYAESTLR